MPSLFTLLPLGVLVAGVPASLGGVPGLELGNVLCDALAAPTALEGASVCTVRYDIGASLRQFEILAHHSGNEARPYLVCNCTCHVSNDPVVSNPLGNTYCVWQTSHFLLLRATSWCDCSATSTTMSSNIAANSLDACSN